MFKVGQKKEIIKSVQKEDVQKFADVSGDWNPLHLDEEYAKNTLFGKCIVHGMLSASYISAILGTDFPGEGTIYLGQNLKFLNPIYIGEEIEISIEIISIDEKNRAVIKTDVRCSDGKLAIEGEAMVKLPSIAK